MLTRSIRSDDMPRANNDTPQTLAILEYLPNADSNVQSVTVDVLPFRLGRTKAADLLIPSGQVSRLHAEIYQTSDGFRIRDLESTNGTFVNGHRVRDAVLEHGDIFHLSHLEFRFLTETEEEADGDMSQTDPFGIGATQPLSVLYNRPLLKEMLEHHSVRTFFQPIVTLRTHEIVGYEALGRGAHSKLSARPNDLFSLAERCQLAQQLSQVFRVAAVADARGLANLPTLFLNTHPAELDNVALLDSLRDLRAVMPGTQGLVLEIHEETVTNLASLKSLRAALRDLNIGLAYDDFGAGQSRLKELIEMPPDYVKLDMTLIRNIHLSAPQQQLVRAITQVAQDLGVQVLAEGIEIEDEAKTCERLGCTLGQGYFLGHPQAAPASEMETWRIECRRLSRQ